METYADDPCTLFGPKVEKEDCTYNAKTLRMIGQMHKAISVIQFKLEAEIIRRRPDFEMDDRMLLHRIDFERKTITMPNGKEYELKDSFLPTVNPADPYKLTDEEREIMNKLHRSFVSSEKLKKHIRCLFRYGCMYTVSNSNLLFHASIPLNADGTLKDVSIAGKMYKGKALLEKVGHLIRTAFFAEEDNEDRPFAVDYVWYLWCGKDSPAFDKDKMATFERYFLKEKELHKEVKGHYYSLRNEEKVCDMLLDEFGVIGTHRHIINGHVPVKTIQGENPIKANGKMMVIDGGFSKAYHSETGIAGYTLIYNSYGLNLTAHEPFTSKADAVARETDIVSNRVAVSYMSRRQLVGDTDTGHALKERIQELIQLLDAYRTGIIKEKK